MLTDLTLENVRERLNLSPRWVQWLERINRNDQADPAPFPSDADAVDLLDRLGVDVAGQAAVIAARPDPAIHPELCWIASRVYQDLIATMGNTIADDNFMRWPDTPDVAHPVGRHLYVWVFLATLPAVRQFHQDRGVPDDVSWATLRALGSELAHRRQLNAISGLTATWTLPLVFRGTSYWLGRHVYERGREVLNVHIPEGGPLDAAASEASFDQARLFFSRHFPEDSVEMFTCHSWLLDPQWENYLATDSNIVRFQKRFTLNPIAAEPEPADHDILKLVFHRIVESDAALMDLLADLPQATTLQRAYVAHLRSGRHWLTRTGSINF